MRSLLLLVLFAAMPARPAGDDALAQAETAAREASRRGHLADAVPLWQRAARLAARGRAFDRQTEAQLRLATVYHTQGDMRQAREALGLAAEVAGKSNQPRLVAQVQAARATLAHKQDEMAERSLRDAVKTLSSGPPDATAARVRNQLGAYLARAGRHDEAVRVFAEAAALGERAGEPSLALQAEANAAVSAGQAQKLEDAGRRARAVLEHSARVAPSHEHALAVLRAGTVFEMLDGRPEGRAQKLRPRAFEAFRRAEEIARGLGDDFALSQALGAQGRLYESERRFEEALALTRRAVFHAQTVRSTDLIFRWTWQAGRLLRDSGDAPAAIAALRRARVELDSIRHDLALHYGHPASGTSFREVTGGLFFDLADLLLRAADAAKGEELQRLLVEARDAAEALKSAELEDYFQDECVSLLRQKTAKVEELSPDAAVIYFIPLRDRTETLVTIGRMLHRVKSAVPGPQVEEASDRLRRALENRTSNEYLEPAKQLHDWLIAPLERVLAGTKPSTLVFVPDGALRTIPMAALHDGQRFLIERYAVAVTPGLTLLEPKPIARGPAGVMLSGLSEARQDFPALPFVPQEIAQLRKLYGGEALLNRDFVLPRVKAEFTGKPFNIVHIASHGHFDRDASKTFVLTFDEKLTLDDLERLLQPARLRDQPVELLALSACQTAAGDDRAALGLAGIAIKAGARSALATLWFVNDEASAQIVIDFYGEQHRSPQLNKAQALQAAQKRLLTDPRYEHPCYWAPYLIIGNWL